jgi:hypothetical protein
LGSLLTWLITEGIKPSSGLKKLRRTLQSPWIVHTTRLLYAVGIPAVALFWQHDLTARGLGLRPLPSSQAAGEEIVASPTYTSATWETWMRDAGWTLALAAALGVLFYVGERTAQRQTPKATGDTEITRHRDLGIALREAVYHQVHWAFYREPFIIRWGIATGSWLGTLPVLLENLLNPLFWERIRAHDETYRRVQIFRWGLLAAGTLVYLKTQNLWLAVGMDALVGWLVMPRESPAAAD